MNSSSMTADDQGRSPVKILFQMVQCLHHLSLLRAGAGNALKAFDRKVQELNRFIRPAMPNKYMAKKIETVNKGWATQMTQTLITHYEAELDFLHGSVSGLNLDKLATTENSNAAKKWAWRNYGKKLQKKTLDDFDQIINGIGKAPANARPGSLPASITGEQSGGVASGVTERQSVASTPKRKRPCPSSPSTSPNQSHTPKRTCATTDQIPSTSYATVAKSPPSVSSFQKRPPRAPAVKRFPKLKPQERGARLHAVWEIPKIEKDILVLGTSNMSNIGVVRRHDAQILSYPGLKLHQLLQLLKGFKYGSGSTNPGLKPSKIVIVAGINDRTLSCSTNETTMKKVVNEAKRTFPGSKILVSQQRFDPKLPQKERDTISKLNDVVRSISGIKCIPPLPLAKFKTIERDNIHWTAECANATIEHIFSCLN